MMSLILQKTSSTLPVVLDTPALPKGPTQGRGIRVLPPKQVLARAGNTSENILNKIRQTVYLIYWAKQISKKINWNQYKDSTIFMNSENSKTSDIRKLHLIDEIDLGKGDNWVALDLSRQQALDAGSKAIQRINFTENLERAGKRTMFFIIEEVYETIIRFFTIYLESAVNPFCEFYLAFYFGINIKWLSITM